MTRKTIKTHMLTICTLLVAVSGFADSYSDADFFGGTNGNGNPNGIQLVAGAGSGSFVQTTFDFVNSDGTSSFTIGDPYAFSDWGTYSSELGYVTGTPIDSDSLFFSFFFRDPNGGSERERIDIDNIHVDQNGNFTVRLNTTLGGSGMLRGTIESTGAVAYRVTASTGEFYLDGAYAGFQTPDGGSTVVMLGVALVGIEMVRRRLRIV
jgi:hypothetical protein